jgi:uncharacterized protein
LTTWPVLTEAAYICNDPGKACDLMDLVVSGAIRVPVQGPSEAGQIKWYFIKYKDRDPDLADLSLLALAEVTGITEIATVDLTDFGIYRLKNGKRLHNLLQP